MTLGVDWEKVKRERARLVILRALAEQVNGALDSRTIEELVLPPFHINEDRVWVHEQMDYLGKRGAAVITEAGTVRIATLTKHGRRHLDRHIAIEGVLRPSEPEGL
ncbi:MAG: hypothetical protein DI589_27685 [Shinella sp.]|jgi:hypothetical protein|nr:MAG: hypothetical protein DI589_27685 [Shinella sp.]